MKSFHQRHFFETRDYHFKKEGLHYVTDHLDGSSDLFIPYDQLLKTQRTYSEKKSFLAVLSMVFMVSGAFLGFLIQRGHLIDPLIALFLFAVGLILLLSYFVGIRNYRAIELTTGQCLFVLKSQPSVSDVNFFVEKLFQERDDYLKTKFFHIDFANHPSAEIRKFDWLRTQGVINDEEFDFMKNKISVLTSNHDED